MEPGILCGCATRLGSVTQDPVGPVAPLGQVGPVCGSAAFCPVR